MNFDENDYSLILKYIIEKGLVKISEKPIFKLKSGEMSNIYVDMRNISSYPNLINLISNKIARTVDPNDFDVICGVPYGAIPIASFISIILQKPLIIIRKEPKAHGLGKMVEGDYKKGSRCLLIEDVITTGTSLMSTINTLEVNDLTISNIKVVLQRDERGMNLLRGMGYEISSYMEIKHVIDYKNINYDVGINKVIKNLKLFPKVNRYRQIIKNKGKICLAADISNWEKLFNLLEQVHPYISMVKMHIDMMEEFDIKYINRLKEMSLKHEFMIWEDRKFNDIGNTFKHQLYGGIYKINMWADFISVNPAAGYKTLEIIKDEKEKGVVTPGIFLLAEMSTKDNLMNCMYTEDVIRIARNNQDLVSGIINQSIEIERISPFLSITPGISRKKEGDNYDQKYRTLENNKLIKNDVFVIGRGIYQADNPIEECIFYQKQTIN